MIERAVGDLLGLDQVKLEVSNVFRVCAVDRFIGKVGKPLHVVGLGINGCLGHVANHQVFGKPLGDGAIAFLVGHHVVALRVGEFRKGTREERERDPTRVLAKAKSASPTIVLNVTAAKYLMKPPQGVATPLRVAASQHAVAEDVFTSCQRAKLTERTIRRADAVRPIAGSHCTAEKACSPRSGARKKRDVRSGRQQH